MRNRSQRDSRRRKDFLRASVQNEETALERLGSVLDRKLFFQGIRRDIQLSLYLTIIMIGSGYLYSQYTQNGRVGIFKVLNRVEDNIAPGREAGFTPEEEIEMSPELQEAREELQGILQRNPPVMHPTMRSIKGQKNPETGFSRCLATTRMNLEKEAGVQIPSGLGSALGALDKINLSNIPEYKGSYLGGSNKNTTVTALPKGVSLHNIHGIDESVNTAIVYTDALTEDAKPYGHTVMLHYDPLFKRRYAFESNRLLYAHQSKRKVTTKIPILRESYREMFDNPKIYRIDFFAGEKSLDLQDRDRELGTIAKFFYIGKSNLDADLEQIAPGQSLNANEQYILRHGGMMQVLYYAYGIPIELSSAQGIHETNAGRSSLAVDANNHFGIKCGTYDGPSSYHKDDCGTEKCCFRAYPDHPFESFAAYGRVLSKPRYVINGHEYHNSEFVRIDKVKKGGYATDDRYVPKIESKRFGNNRRALSQHITIIEQVENTDFRNLGSQQQLEGNLYMRQQKPNRQSPHHHTNIRGNLRYPRQRFHHKT